MRRLLPYLAYAYLSFVGWTTRWRVIRAGGRDALRARGQRFIYALWHQRQIFLTVSHRGDPTKILASRSADGDIVAEVIRLSRLGSCRGSSSRGGAAATRDMMEAVQSGWDLAITPDGPRGPAREIKTGILFLAQKLNVPILPITTGLSNRLELSRAWDKFQVPLPFGRAVVVYGEPLWVKDGDDLATKAAELKASMDAITLEADKEVGRA